MKKNKLIKYGLLVLILAAIPISVNLVQNSQENRSNAANNSGSSKRLVVASFNIGNGNKHGGTTSSEFAKEIKKDNFDIVGLQEAKSGLSKEIANKSDLTNFFYTSTSAGNTIISKKALGDTSYVRLTKCGDDSFRAIQKTVIKVNNRDISFYNAHIDFNSSCRKKQALDVVDVIKKDPNPYILVGDFNFGRSGCSISDGIFKEGRGIVYDSNYGTKCTDMIIYSKNRGIKVVSSKTYRTAGNLSDHNIVSATFEVE